MRSALKFLALIVIAVAFGSATTSGAAPKRASSFVKINSVTSAACNRYGGEVNVSISVSPGISPTVLKYHAVYSGGLDVNNINSTYVPFPTTFNKKIKWTGDGQVFWEQKQVYYINIAPLLYRGDTVVDSSRLSITCRKPSEVIIDYH